MIGSPTRPQITREERYWAQLYESLLRRYDDWFVTMNAVRLYAKRLGLDNLLKLLVKHGVPMVADRCRHEMTVRQEFFAHMMAKNPPPDPQEGEEAIQEMAEDLVWIDSPAGALRLQRFLERLLKRKKTLNSALQKTRGVVFWSWPYRGPSPG